MSATKVIYDFIQKSEHLSLIGNIMSLIAFHSEKYDIPYRADELSNLGWYIGGCKTLVVFLVSQIHADLLLILCVWELVN